MNPYLVIHPEVQKALKENKAVVALESTIITHGMPSPQNIETAISVEEIIRKEGAVPATIAILKGKCCIGLDEQQLKELAGATGVWKVSTRDISYVVQQNLYGGTTVAATMKLAEMAGIKVFVTGGIGGVHRGVETTMDISADLIEMSKTSVAVVSAGVKSILDIGLTLEYLETFGVPVVTYGQEEFPAFYSRQSGYTSPLTLKTPEEIARLIITKWKMGLEGSVFIANPIPLENEVPLIEMEKYIQTALVEAAKENIIGKEVTPFLLKYIAGQTKGKSLEANIALIKNNAKLGARIAVAYAALNEV
jgi:pseudouridylate synthase